MPEAAAVLDRLAAHALSDAVTPEAIGAEATERAAWHLLDLFGCFVGAARLGVNNRLAALAERLGGPEEATLWGSQVRVPAGHAALANGTIAHHLELDGGWHGPPGVGAHPAVTILPAALATAEQVGASGSELLAAAAAGYDVLAALATWLCPGVTRYRLHPPALSGAFGAAAAVGRLRGVSQERLVGALARCAGLAPLAPFEAFTDGASVKDLYGGWPGYVGVAAHEAARPDPPWFTLHRLLEREEAGAEAALAGLSRPALLDCDFKPYPTCRSVQPALTALEALLEERPLDPRAVTRIEVETYPYAVELDESANEGTPIGARTSLRTCLALRLLHGPLTPEHFAPACLADPEMRRLADATAVSVGRFATARRRGAAIRLRLADGAWLEREVSSARWDAAAPPTTAELLTKYRALAEPTLGPDGAAALADQSLRLARLDTVQPLLDALAGARVKAPTTPAALPAVDRAILERAARALPAIERRLAERGADPKPLAETIRFILDAPRPEPARQAAALSIALSLAPAGAGPAPWGWPTRLVGWSYWLAEAGFSGPNGVIDGRRGLHHLLLDEDR